jgi:hypothetical protein
MGLIQFQTFAPGQCSFTKSTTTRFILLVTV